MQVQGRGDHTSRGVGGRVRLHQEGGQQGGLQPQDQAPLTSQVSSYILQLLCYLQKLQCSDTASTAADLMDSPFRM